MWNTYAMKIDWHAITQKSELSWELHMHNKINISWTFFALLHSFTHSFSLSPSLPLSKLNAMCRVKWLDVWKILDIKNIYKYHVCDFCFSNSFFSFTVAVYGYTKTTDALNVSRRKQFKIKCAESTLTIAYMICMIWAFRFMMLKYANMRFFEIEVWLCYLF